MMTTNDEGLSQLSKMGGGGGVVARSAKCLIVAIFTKDGMMSTNMN